MSIENFLAVMAIIAANLGTVLALFMHSDKKLDEHRKEVNGIMKSIQEEVKGIQVEMKEFHTRLAVQDQEFKMRLCSIEERIKK